MGTKKPLHWYDFLTLTQRNKLKNSGITMLYDVITYIPYDVECIMPWHDRKHALTTFGKEADGFLVEGILINVSQHYGKRPYWVLRIQTDRHVLVLYYFATGKYLKQFLTVGTTFQILFVESNIALRVVRIAPKKSVPHAYQRLGSLPMQPVILPKYAARGPFDNMFWRSIIERLPREYFVLDITGLYPPGMPHSIDMYPVHHPRSIAEYVTTRQQFTAFQVYLYLALERYMRLTSHKMLAPKISLDKEYLSKLSATLPFELTHSQKVIIWNILSAMS